MDFPWQTGWQCHNQMLLPPCTDAHVELVNICEHMWTWWFSHGFWSYFQTQMESNPGGTSTWLRLEVPGTQQKIGASENGYRIPSSHYLFIWKMMSHVKLVKKPLLRFLKLETSMKRLSYGSRGHENKPSCKNWYGIGSGILIMIMNSIWPGDTGRWDSYQHGLKLVNIYIDLEKRFGKFYGFP